MTAAGIDAVYRRVQRGDRTAFVEWVCVAEPFLRRSLRSFARSVDVESIVQETLLRMWVAAPRIRLDRREASLRYAARVGRNLALEECRRHRIVDPAGDASGEPAADPLEPPDPALRRLIARCLEALTARPRRALRARLGARGGETDADLARQVGMKLNTFLQNVGRARRQMAECLERNGVPVERFIR
ncbi:MAG: hypothetical protein Kow0062_04520 [Acidobacteriota bacterium]|nr:MAG: sigma-70 family RNA polymerase sigma factor [Acidobacteriota bacterium]